MADPNKPSGNIKSLATVTVIQPMMDDQMSVMHVQPLDENGQPSALPSGSPPPVYTTDDPTSVTLAPAPDGLSCNCSGVKGKAGTPTITATFTNADGSTAVGSGQLTITIDPAELDVSSLSVSFDAPVKQ